MSPFHAHSLWSATVALAVSLAASAAASPSTYPIPPQVTAAGHTCRPLPRTGTNDDVALGALPDGTVWYGDRRGHRLVRISADGHHGPLVPGDGTTSALSGLALGPDGSVWYTKDSSSRIGRIGPRGDSREFTTPEPGSFPGGLVADRAARLWFHSRVKNYVARVHESGAVTVYRGPVALSTGFAPQGMTLGADGNLWLTDRGHNAIYRFDVESHRFTRFDIATPRADPGAITAGPDGNVWFTMNAVGRVGRITPQGEITEIALGDLAGASLRGIASTPDGSMWVTTRGRLAVRILADGGAHTFPCANALGTAIAGPGGVPWFFDDQRVWVVDTPASSRAPADARAPAPGER